MTIIYYVNSWSKNCFGWIPDTLKLARKMFKKEDVGNYKQQNLVKKLLGKSYEAHDALEDVKSLHELFVNKLQYTCKDIFPFNHTQLVASYKDISNTSMITKAVACRMANSGIGLKHLELPHKRGSQNGILFFWLFKENCQNYLCLFWKQWRMSWIVY